MSSKKRFTVCHIVSIYVRSGFAAGVRRAFETVNGPPTNAKPVLAVVHYIFISKTTLSCPGPE